MAGHSHATNVKWRKDRQSKVRSKIHQKARRDIELLIQEEGKLSEKALNIARQHNFSKEKVYQIWEKIKLEKEKNNLSQQHDNPGHNIFFITQSTLYSISNLHVNNLIRKLLTIIYCQISPSSLKNKLYPWKPTEKQLWRSIRKFAGQMHLWKKWSWFLYYLPVCCFGLAAI